MPSFDINLESGIEIYRRIINGENDLYNDKKSPSETRSIVKKEMVLFAINQKQPVVEAYVRYLYGKSILENEEDKKTAFNEFKVAIHELSVLKKEVETVNDIIGIKPSKLYNQILYSILQLREYLSEKGDRKNPKLKDSIDSWVKASFPKDKFAKSPFHQHGVDAVRSLKKIKDDYDTAEALRKEKKKELQKSFLIYYVPSTSIFFITLFLYINRRWPEINIMVTRKRWMERIKQSNSPQSNSVGERLRLPILHYNDPLFYILSIKKKISVFKLSLYAFIFMFILHFLFALFDNTLYFGQGGVLSNIKNTFFTWPTGHSPSQKEYFFNDYYGLFVNSIFNPLICVLIFCVYRNFGNIWRKLFEEKILEIKDKRYINKIYNYANRDFNRRWYFWLCFLLSISVSFWMLYGVYNQPDRDSYLDFSERLMPIYHHLYLALTWYIMGMFAIKTVIAARLIRKIFVKYVGKNKITLNLKPLHPDSCSGMSYFGRYARRVQFILTLITLSVLARTFLDFVIVGTPITKMPQMFVGFVIYVIFTPIMSYFPIYLVRKGIMITKETTLTKFSLQRQNAMEMGRMGEVDIITREAEQIRKIPNGPLDFKSFSRYIGSVIIPIILSAILGTVFQKITSNSF